MIICKSWLREWVDPEWDTRQLTSRLTMAGLEVKGVSAVSLEFTNIVVGQVDTVDPHPDADKLRVCLVFDGSTRFQVVCGAPNVRTGMRAPFARVGAEIQPGDGKPFKIKTARLRGVESNGMLCSAEELGLAESSDGLMELPDDAPVGSDLRNYLHLEDVSIELDLTPNRGDCLSVNGVAREVGVLARMPLSIPDIKPVPVLHNEEFPVSITARQQCPRYLGRVIRNINQDVEVPLWMQEKLRRSGMRSIDPIVDVTNYVLMELGQPMHAFDYRKLTAGIEVRLPHPHETITLLDGKEVELSEDTLVIADAEKPVAMAGIMGGLSSAVSRDTTDVFLECAFFAPLAVAGRARSYGMHTDASHRYERGVDHTLQHRAMERATGLLLQLVGGEAGPVTEAVGHLPESEKVALRFNSIERVLGVCLKPSEVEDILSRLGFDVVEKTAAGLQVDVPSFRFDVSIEADLIEELARIHGYDKIPAGQGVSARPRVESSENSLELSRIRDHLVTLGYQEVISYSFIDPKLSKLVTATEESTISLQNPISEDMGVMRTSLLPGLLNSLKYNANRQQERIRLFESGLCFRRVGGVTEQTPRLGAVVKGSLQPKNWSNEHKLTDFFDVKGDVEVLASLGGTDFSFRPAQQSPFHPGQCAELLSTNGEVVGILGTLHPAIERKLGLEEGICLFELELDHLLEARLPQVNALSKFPEVSRDLAIVVKESIPTDEITSLLHKTAGENLCDLRIFDIYQGDAVEKGKKSVALGLTWQHPSRTLGDDEINTVIENCVKALENQLDANLRN
ncbi:MAG: phenylalanine--tRNA ligase subunit beta [Gammaproteobacteria bacterium]|nr:phenylalanine--tRNA ligase subunit beta [Gammaproteobacteria bacterium]